MLANQLDHGDRNRAKVQRPALRDAHAGEIEELGKQPGEPIALVHDQAREELVLGVRPLGAAELLHRRADRRQRVPDLMCQAGRQLRHGLEALGPKVELLEPLGIRDVGENRRDAGRGGAAGLLVRRGRDPDGERAIRPPHHGFHPHRPHAPARRGRQRSPELRRHSRELGHDGSAQPLPLPEPQDLLGGGIAVQQPAVAVHRHDPRRDAPQHVRRFQPHLAQLTGQRFVLGAHRGYAARQVGGHGPDHREQPELQRDPRAGRELVPEDHIGEVHQPHERRHQRRARGRHQERRHHDQRHVQRREVARRTARDVHDRRDQGDVEQRLSVQERPPRRAAPDVRMPVRCDRDDHRHHEEERGDEEVERGGDVELEGRAQVNGPGHRHPHNVDPPQQDRGHRHRRAREITARPLHHRAPSETAVRRRP